MYSDSDWAGDVNDRKSVGAYCLLLSTVAISWRSKKQAVTSRSSAKLNIEHLQMPLVRSYGFSMFLQILAFLAIVLSPCSVTTKQQLILLQIQSIMLVQNISS